MRLCVRALGIELLFIELSEAEDSERGAPDSTSYPIGFTARMEIPEECEADL